VTPHIRTASTGGKRRLATVAVIGASAAVLAACGSGSTGGNSGGGGASDAPTGSAAGFAPVTGKVVSTGSSGARVSTTSGKTDVAFASTTRFTTLATIDKAALKVGQCVTVSSSSTTSSATAITATTITVTSNTACSTARSFGRPGTGNGGPPSGGSVASGAPGGEGFPGGTSGSGGLPDGTPPTGGASGSGNRVGGFPRAGTITSISGSTITIKSLVRGVAGGSSSPSTGHVTVTTSGSTTLRRSVTGSKSDVVTGTCLTAIGQKTSGGVVDAFSVTVSSPSDGTCTASTSGFGGGFGFGGPRGSRPNGSTSA